MFGPYIKLVLNVSIKTNLVPRFTILDRFMTISGNRPMNNGQHQIAASQQFLLYTSSPQCFDFELLSSFKF